MSASGPGLISHPCADLVPSVDDHSCICVVPTQIYVASSNFGLPLVANTGVKGPVYDLYIINVLALQPKIGLACAEIGVRVSENFKVALSQAVVAECLVEGLEIGSVEVADTSGPEVVDTAEVSEGVFSCLSDGEVPFCPLGRGCLIKLRVDHCAGAQGQQGHKSRKNAHKGISFVWFWNTAKGADNRGDAQALVVCENTAGSGLVGFAVHADRGQARPQVAPIPSLLNLARVGLAKAARPVFFWDGRRTAKRSAVQQAVTSLLTLPLGSGCSQKSVRFCFGIWVFFTLEHFTNAVCVGSEFVNDVGVSDTLHAHDVGCYSLCECESASLFGDHVHNDPCNWVSFGWGFSPKQVSHGCSFLNMVGRVASGRSGFLPAILWFRTLRKGAGSLIGVVGTKRHPDLHTPQQKQVVRKGLFCRLLGRICGKPVYKSPSRFGNYLKNKEKITIIFFLTFFRMVELGRSARLKYSPVVIPYFELNLLKVEAYD